MLRPLGLLRVVYSGRDVLVYFFGSWSVLLAVGSTSVGGRRSLGLLAAFSRFGNIRDTLRSSVALVATVLFLLVGSFGVSGLVHLAWFVRLVATFAAGFPRRVLVATVARMRTRLVRLGRRNGYLLDYINHNKRFFFAAYIRCSVGGRDGRVVVELGFREKVDLRGDFHNNLLLWSRSRRHQVVDGFRQLPVRHVACQDFVALQHISLCFFEGFREVFRKRHFSRWAGATDENFDKVVQSHGHVVAKRLMQAHGMQKFQDGVHKFQLFVVQIDSVHNGICGRRRRVHRRSLVLVVQIVDRIIAIVRHVFVQVVQRGYIPFFRRRHNSHILIVLGLGRRVRSRRRNHGLDELLTQRFQFANHLVDKSLVRQHLQLLLVQLLRLSFQRILQRLDLFLFLLERAQLFVQHDGIRMVQRRIVHDDLLLLGILLALLGTSILLLCGLSVILQGCVASHSHAVTVCLLDGLVMRSRRI
ncbi:hypothetical protein H257_10622 [Aphanomyces astaci]|uniref:Uncharacterized protein n=1 Tax=Aphanomyces astaci TaxID=112090 RepID=W4G5R5_APHAT|nr:hypothetical protein H257_10622 [Aphanomyces astaci]ETV75020.1 hypothetical protein H257_10622 [Aphanomyces astaci]|eukprot:XP_009835524.1 hypothetical protein H257_10622 [Aphanomyces astaci]